MRSQPFARIWHAATAATAAVSLLIQLVLVLAGHAVLVEEDTPSMAAQLLRFVSYFTIQANVLVLVTTVSLARNPQHDGRAWRVLRLAAITGIGVTGLVHWFFLRPLLHLTGWSYAVDKLLHVAVPLSAVVGWLLFGPRSRVTGRVIALSLIWPAAWLAYTMIMGAAVHWYPYPFLDIRKVGVGGFVVAAVAITALFVVVSLLVRLGDRRLRVVATESLQ